MVNRKNINKVVYCLFGTRSIQLLWNTLFGNRWRGWFLGLIRYKAVYMVHPGETVILGGVFSEGYVEDYAAVIGKTGTVVVVEANPENIKRLKKRFVSFEQVVFVNKAIWNECGEISFLAASEDQAQGYNRIEKEDIAEYPLHLVQKVRKIKVQACSLDSICKDLNLKTVHQINLTINGAELPALEGLEQIRHNNPNVRIYINSQYPEPAEKVVSLLKLSGFQVYTSKLITTTNKKIRLIRIYAFGVAG